MNRFLAGLVLLCASLCLVPAQSESLNKPYYVTPRQGAEHLELDGAWQLGYRDAAVNSPDELSGQQWLSTELPGSVQMALYHAGKLPDPYKGMNSKLYEWVGGKVWYYQKHFKLPAGTKGNNILLCFDGVDYYSRVWLNGHLLGEHQGMLGGPDIDISQWARAGGDNDLLVEVKAANWGAKGSFESRSPKTVIKPWSLAGGTGGEPFFSLGIWRPVRIEMLPKIHMDRPFLITETATESEAKLHLSVEILAGVSSNSGEMHDWTSGRAVQFRDSWTAKKVQTPIQVELILRDGDKVVNRERFTANILEGRNWVEHSFVVNQPHLWWPNGMGDAHLYRVELKLLEGARQDDQIAFDYGIRTIQTVPSAGPRTQDIWENWQFKVNGKPFFVKGVNWMAADILYNLPRSKYEWLLGMAKNAGIQFIRIWGGSFVETNDFYELCDRKGILVWQEFPLSNMLTPQWPQKVWEDQIARNVFRLRNHSSLAMWGAGNESNPYAAENATSTGIFERTVRELDPTRPYRRSSPDGGDVHKYPDMDPTWYGKLYKFVPFVSETGLHNIPSASTMREVVSADEFKKPLTGMYDGEFAAGHPELTQHFVEYQPDRVPRMLSRASQVEDISSPTIETLAESTQIGAGEFYQIASEQIQNNYPVTTGLMPWVFARSWPTIAIQLVDGLGVPTAPYYFLSRTYLPEHVMVQLPEILWAEGETVPINVAILPGQKSEDRQVTVRIYDPELHEVWRKSAHAVSGTGVVRVKLGEFSIPKTFADSFFFIDAELRDKEGRLLSRSVYWPRCLRSMSDPHFRADYRMTPHPALAFDKGPWLKPQVEKAQTTLHGTVVSNVALHRNRSRIVLRIQNVGTVPSFLTQVDIRDVKSSFYLTDNYFWLAPQETRTITVEVHWRGDDQKTEAHMVIHAWNTNEVVLPISLNAEEAGIHSNR